MGCIHWCDREDRCLVLLLALIVILTLGIVFLVVSTYPTYTICTTLECNRSAEEYRTTVDLTVDPCDDFYEFVCRKWSERHPLPVNAKIHDWRYVVTNNVLDKVYEFLTMNSSLDDPFPVLQARQMFTTCLDVEKHEGFEQLFELLDRLKLPRTPSALTSEASSDPSFDWISTIVLIRKLLDLNVLINFSIETELYNKGTNRVAFELPKLANETGLKAARTSRSDFSEIAYIVRVLNRVAPTNPARIIEVAQQIDRLDTEISAIIAKFKTLVGIDTVHNYTIAEMQANLSVTEQPGPFARYVELMFDDLPEPVKFDVAKEKIVTTFYDMQYFSKILGHLAANMTTEDTELYIWWKVVALVVPHTNDDMRIVHEAKEHTTRPRQRYCLEEVNSLMGMAVGPAIIDDQFQHTIQPEVELIFENLRSAFKKLATNQHWMGKEQQANTLRKLDSMKLLVGYPDFVANKSGLAHYYAGLNVSNTSHLMNRVGVKSWDLRKRMLQRHVSNGMRWDIAPTTVNAFYLTDQNAVNLPIGFLQYPYYHLGLHALDYGTLGEIIGHEITHGFDNSGRHFDHNGNLAVEYQSNETQKLYEDKTLCFVEQYNDYKIPEAAGQVVDGILTLDENIADNGGLNVAFLAYKLYKSKPGRQGRSQRLPGLEQFTEDQLFFLSFGNNQCEILTKQGAIEQLADTHAPARVRVNAALANSEDFRRTFRCRRNTAAMFNHHYQQCRIW